MANNTTFDQRKPVDFAIIGSGAAGGIIAKELSTAGFDVVVFEQGPYRKAEDFTHDEYAVLFNNELMGGGPDVSGQTFRRYESEEATSRGTPVLEYAQTVGGSSVHFSANFWRFREIDFKERGVLGRLQETRPHVLVQHLVDDRRVAAAVLPHDRHELGIQHRLEQLVQDRLAAVEVGRVLDGLAENQRDRSLPS